MKVLLPALWFLISCALVGCDGQPPAGGQADKPQGDKPPAAKAQAASPTLQAAWEVVSLEAGGKPIDRTLNPNHHLVFTKTALTITGQHPESGSYTINPSKTPAEIDLTLDETKKALGIYELQGDSLKLCIGKDRPTEFATQEGQEATLFVLRLAATVPAATPGSLEGSWYATAMENMGKPAPPKGMRIVMTKNSFAIPGNAGTKASYTVNPRKKPGEIDLTMERPNGATAAVLGIYELSGDSLKLCITDPGQPRPTEFATKADQKEILFVLERGAPVPEADKK